MKIRTFFKTLFCAGLVLSLALYLLYLHGNHIEKTQKPYLQPIITQYFIDNKSEIWLLFLIAHSKR